MQKKLQREEQKRLKREEIESKKKEREMKKNERKSKQIEIKKKGEMKAKKGKDLTVKMRKNGSAAGKQKTGTQKTCTLMDDESCVCPTCGLMYSSDNDDQLWVCCDKCDLWYNFECTGLKSKTRIPKVYYCTCCSSC